MWFSHPARDLGVVVVSLGAQGVPDIGEADLQSGGGFGAGDGEPLRLVADEAVQEILVDEGGDGGLNDGHGGEDGEDGKGKWGWWWWW